MKKKVLIFDTSVLCVWLKVPGKETCGPEDNRLTYDVVNARIEEEKGQGTTFVLPIASIIETGNHIAHSAGDKHVVGHAFADIISATADQISPWAAFTEQSELWKKENLKVLAERWKESVISGQSLGDASIVDVANYYASADFEVEIFTGDEGLKAYEPSTPMVKPRRRR
jgi:hypothetical protein